MKRRRDEAGRQAPSSASAFGSPRPHLRQDDTAPRLAPRPKAVYLPRRGERSSPPFPVTTQPLPSDEPTPTPFSPAPVDPFLSETYAYSEAEIQELLDALAATQGGYLILPPSATAMQPPVGPRPYSKASPIPLEQMARPQPLRTPMASYRSPAQHLSPRNYTRPPDPFTRMAPNAVTRPQDSWNIAPSSSSGSGHSPSRLVAPARSNKTAVANFGMVVVPPTFLAATVTLLSKGYVHLKGPSWGAHANTNRFQKYGRGNLTRHMKQKHGDGSLLRCEAANCSRVYARSDARQVHYRKHHPWLAGGTSHG